MLYLSAYIFVVATVLDSLTTYIGLQFPNVYETNRFMLYAISSIGLGPAIAFELLASCIFICGIVIELEKEKYEALVANLFCFAFLGLSVWTFAAVLNNIRVIVSVYAS